MAKVKFSALISEMRNKLNGSVFSKNRAGNYLRNKVTPVNPQTTRQSAVRSQLTSYAQGWRSLSQNDRDAWSSAVGNFTKTDIFGDVKTPSGLNLYTRLNMNLTQIGGTPISTPPTPVAVASIESLTLTSAAGTPALSLAFAPSPIDASTDWIVEATPPVSAGKSFVKSEFRQIKIIAGGATTPNNLLVAYQGVFGNPIEAQKIFVRVTPVENTTGIRGQSLVAYAVVAP